MDVAVHDDYGLVVPLMTDEVCTAVVGQSLAPSVVYASCDDQQRARLRAAGIDVRAPGTSVDPADGPRPTWLGLADDCDRWGRYHFENLLLAAQWPGGAQRLVPVGHCHGPFVLAEKDDGQPGDWGLVRAAAVDHDVRDALVGRREFLRMAVDVGPATDQEESAGADYQPASSEHLVAVAPVT